MLENVPYCSYKFYGYVRNKYYLFRIMVVTCSVLATVYYGYECTKKYISDPITVSDEMVPLDSLPPLQWSICKQVHLTDCTIPVDYYSFLHDGGYYYYNDETTTTPSVGKYLLANVKSY